MYISNYLYTFQSRTTSDYYKEMNHSNFKVWFKELLLKKIPQNWNIAVIVMDKAPYCSVIKYKALIMAFTRRRHDSVAKTLKYFR